MKTYSKIIYLSIALLPLHIHSILKIVHRAGPSNHQENSLNGIQQLLDNKTLNFDAIEIDVQCTKDCKAIVLHDETLNRTTTAKGKVENYTLQELHQFTMQDGQPIPTLEQVLQKINRSSKICIELKSLCVVNPTAETIKHAITNLNWRESDFLIISFDEQSLKNFHRHCPHITTGLLIEGTHNLNETIKKTKRSSARYIIFYNQDVTKKTITAIHKHGLKVGSCVIDSAQEAIELEKRGIDGIASDKPEIFESLKTARMQEKF